MQFSDCTLWKVLFSESHLMSNYYDVGVYSLGKRYA